MLQRQRTLARAVQTAGIGLHTGEQVALRLCPLAVNRGVVFRRVDVVPAVDIAARVPNVADTRLSTTLEGGGQRISTVEHLLAALSGMGVDNVLVELSAAEVPIMDGSAGPFVSLIQSAGLVEQAALRRYLRVKEEVVVTDGDKQAGFFPFDGFKVAFTIDFEQPVLRRQATHAELDFSRNCFERDVSRARTFGFARDVEAMRARGLARGGSLDNAILLEDDRILNREGLRSEDEFVKHKVLDAMGDLYLLGCGLLGEFRAHKSGHALNNRALRQLLAQPEAWELVTLDGDLRWTPAAASGDFTPGSGV